MTDKELIFDILRRMGKEVATKTQADAIAGKLTPTEIIESENYIPEWRQGKYNTVGALVKYKVNDEYQIFKVWQTHDSTNNPAWNPADAVSLFDIYHSSDPASAKPFVEPQGTRGMYQQGECMIWTDDEVYISTLANNVYTPETYPSGWKKYSGDDTE